MSEIPARIRAAVYRLITVWRRDALHDELRDEMAFHRELLARDLEHDGLSPTDAIAEARRRFGNDLLLRERSGDAWGVPFVEQLWQDLRYGGRVLRSSPGFTLVAVGALALAIGINAGFFTLVDAFMWQPIPVARPERIVKLLTRDVRGVSDIRFSYTDYQLIASHSKTLEDVVAYDAQPAAVRTMGTASGGRAAQVSVGLVSANYFTALGGTSTAGRLLGTVDARSDASPVVVLSDAAWSSLFARSPRAVGSTVIVGSTHATVVGIADPDFVGINPLMPDLWMTFPHGDAAGIVPGRLLDRRNRFIGLHARLRPGFSMAQAGAELSGIMAEPPAPRGSREELTRISGAWLMPGAALVPPQSSTALVLAPALAVVALVLLIACANLANLLLSRALARQREIAVRLAIGASRERLLRQLLAESLLTAVLGAAVGLVLAHWTVTVVARMFFDAVPTTFGHVALGLHTSWRVVAYTGGLAVVSAIAFGLAPALQATALDLTSELKGNDAVLGSRLKRSRFRDVLVAAQVAGCVVLLVAAATLVRGVHGLARYDDGFEARQVAALTLGLSAKEHVSPALASDRAEFAARIAHDPDVVATARVLAMPFDTWPLLQVIPPDGSAQVRSVYFNHVTPRYFDVVGQHLVAGRVFSAQDSATGGDVGIVTVAAARRFWSSATPIGQSIRLVPGGDSIGRIVRIIGVVADSHNATIWDEDSGGYLYLPATTRDFTTLDMPLLVRAAPGAAAVARRIDDIAVQVSPSEPLHAEPLSALRDLQLMPLRYAAVITTTVGILGLALALLGLYGVVSFAVRQRRRDIAVHVAMGAGPRDVLGLVLRRELRFVALGLGVGLVLSAGEAALIANLTLPFPAIGAAAMLALTLVLLVVATVATIIPAAGALRIAPMQVLRQE